MGKAIDLVHAATEDTQSKTSAGMSLKSQHSELSAANVESESPQTATTQRCTIQISVQNKSASSEVMPTLALDPSKKEQVETNKPRSQRENGTQAQATEVRTNPKKSRQRLRKGKWTIEEEEYTSRIIQYFSTGLLTLPDGATLRSYLAEKLNCDPMRITKKFTGACCLGRRAYHLRDRPRASPAEIEMASFELLHLEQRFRLRVEHDQTGVPLPQRHELLASQPTPTAAVAPSLFTLQQGAQRIKATNQWIQNPIIAPSPVHLSLLPGLAGIIPNSSVPNANLNLHNSSSLLLAAGQLLLQNPGERARANNSSAATAPLQILNNLVTSYALSRAITQHQAGMSVFQPSGSSTSPISGAATKVTSSSLAPSSTTFNVNVPDIATSANKEPPQTFVAGIQGQHFLNAQSFQQQQHEIINSSTSTSRVSKKEEHTQKLKAAFEEQQRALRMAYEKSLQDAQEREEKSFDFETPNAASDSKGSKLTTIVSTTSNDSKSTLEIVSPAEQLQRSYEAHLASLQRAEQQSSLKASSKLTPSLSQSKPASGAEVEEKKTKSSKTEGKGRSSQKKTQDEEAGAILLGFLNSLRESFEDAVEAKDGKKETREWSGDITRYKKVPRGSLNTETIPSVQLESSTEMTEVSSDSSSHVIERRNAKNNDHPKPSINSRRQDSDPITSLSHFQSSKRKAKPASVTETSSSTSSQPTIEQPSSSQEDSKSDKMSNSSSEESDKEIVASRRRISKGPPRKRLKNFHEPHEFTRENLMAHSKRMDMECGQSGDASSSDE